MDSPLPPLDLREELGAGTTGRVWRAVSTRNWEGVPEGVEVAFKRLSPETAADPARREAFELEATAACSLRIPGVVEGYARGEDPDGAWLVLRFVPGPTLRELLEEFGPLPEPQVRSIALRLAGALESLESSGYLHGDLKPENVRLDEDGRPVLLDLGFVRPLAEESRRAVASTRIAGSLAYLSPEEARGGSATSQSEIFSLGILLYEIATGTHPFLEPGTEGDAEACLRALLEGRRSPPSLLVPTLSPFLDLLVGGMLQRDPSLRPTARELHRRLREEEEGVWWRSQLDLHEEARRSSRAVATERQLPLVGREKELEGLLRAARSTLTPAGVAGTATGGVVELDGPEGSGRSRLMQEFATLVRRSEDPPLYLYGRCNRFEEQRPCQPVLTLLSRYLGLPPGSAPGNRDHAALDALVHAEERDTLLDALHPSFQGTTPASVPVALASWLAALASRTPVIVYLDDVHWADEGTLHVLTRLVDHLPGLALLLVLGSRVDSEPRRAEAFGRLKEHVNRLEFRESIELGSLDHEAVLSLVEQCFASSVPRLRLAQVLWKRSRGNPGFIAEIVRGLVDRGQVQPTSEGLELRVHPEDLPLPASLRGAIAESYGRLRRSERGWLSRLAVAGGRIRTSFLLRAWPDEDASELDRVLASLSRSGWLVPMGSRYRFARPALREAVYKSLPDARLIGMHAEVARALQPERGGRLSITDGFQRAFHLRAARRYAELLRLLRPLLRSLLGRGQPQRVYTLGEWGLEALDHLPPSPTHLGLAAEFLAAGADAADRLGFREKQRGFLDRLADLGLDTESHPEDAARIYLLHARHAIGTGQYGTARGMLRNATECAERAGSRELLSDSLRRWSEIDGNVGDLVDARRLARRAWEVAPSALLRAQAEHALGVIDLLEDRVEGALRHSDRCTILLRRCDGIQAIATRAIANSLRGRVYRGAGRPRRALGSAQRALRFARRSGDRQLEAELRARLGVHLQDIDRPDDAERALRDGLLLAQEMQDRRCESMVSIFLGILLLEKDDPGAEGFLRKGTALAREMGQGRVEAVGLAMQARERLWESPAEVEWMSEKAVGLVNRYGAELIDRIVIVGTHAVVLDRVRRGGEARELIRALRRRMRRENDRIVSPLLKRRQRLASTKFLEAVLSAEGPVYRRVRLEVGEVEWGI